MRTELRPLSLSLSRSLTLYIYIYIYIYIYLQHFFVNTNFFKHNRHFLSTYFLLDPFVLANCFYRIQRELIYVLFLVVCIPSTFCRTLGHHQGRIYYKSDVTFVFAYYYYVRTSLLWCYIYIYIFRQHFFVNANFIKDNRHFMSTYFLLDPFEFPYYF